MAPCSLIMMCIVCSMFFHTSLKKYLPHLMTNGPFCMLDLESKQQCLHTRKELNVQFPVLSPAIFDILLSYRQAAKTTWQAHIWNISKMAMTMKQSWKLVCTSEYLQLILLCPIKRDVPIHLYIGVQIRIAVCSQVCFDENRCFYFLFEKFIPLSSRTIT